MKVDVAVVIVNLFIIIKIAKLKLFFNLKIFYQNTSKYQACPLIIQFTNNLYPIGDRKFLSII